MELSRASQVRWNKLDADHGGELDVRAQKIRSGPIKFSQREAIIAVVAEMLHYDCGDTASLLGVDEHTIHNYHSTIWKKMGKTRKDCAFDALFLNYPPPE